MSAAADMLRARLAQSRTFKDVVDRSFEARPPASPAAVAACEQALGFALPPLLREVYLDLANGGFGPGYGVMGVADGHRDDRGETITTLALTYRERDPDDPEWRWGAAWLPFCHWGCGIYSVVDCVAPWPVFYVDPTVKEIGASMSSIIVSHKPSLTAWFEDWLAGKDLWKEAWA